MGGPVTWSTDPEQNDTIDPDIFLAEGQPPPTLNNACRAIMAGLAKLLRDTTGDNAATGAAGGALSISTAQGLTLTRPFELSWKIDGRNIGPTTMSVDGSAQRPIQRPGNIDLAPGDLVPGIIYKSRYHPGVNRHILLSPIPERPGRVVAFATEAAIPDGWVICDGRSLSRTAYAALFGEIGTRYGPSDASNFSVPDLNGRTVFGADNQGTKTANRLTGAGGIDGTVGTAGGTEATALTSNQMPSHTHAGSTNPAGDQAASSTGAAGAHNHGGATGAAGAHTHNGTTASAGSHTHTASTGAAGGHGHEQRYTTISGVQAGGGLTLMAVLANAPGVNYNASGQNEAVGGHTHDVTVVGGGDHQHPFTTDQATAHGHSITSAADHSHSIPSVPAHTHAVALNNAGGGAAHPNMPPGLVMLWAIKA